MAVHGLHMMIQITHLQLLLRNLLHTHKQTCVERGSIPLFLLINFVFVAELL